MNAKGIIFNVLLHLLFATDFFYLLSVRDRFTSAQERRSQAR